MGPIKNRVMVFEMEISLTWLAVEEVNKRVDLLDVGGSESAIVPMLEMIISD